MGRERLSENAVILHNIRSAQNVGAIFRTADAAGVARIYLAGYTPTPIDRFGRTRADVAKTALGAEETVPWEHHASFTALARRLKAVGTTLVAVEQASNAVDYRKLKHETPMAFVFGNEVRGLSPQTRARCDITVEIPSVGSKESLNVAVAAGVVLFRVLGMNHYPR